MASLALARAYQQSFDTHPYATLAFTNGFLNALGDGVAQTAQRVIASRNQGEHDRPVHYDFARTARFFTFGFAMGPFIGRWNQFLEHRFPLRALAPKPGQPPGQVSGRALAKRVAADQLIMAPIGLTMFIGSMGYMEGRDAQHIKNKYKEMYVPAIMANWQVWPLAQLINFRYMPLPFRVPFQSTCGVFWTLYLSMLNSGDDAKQDRRDTMRGTVNAQAVPQQELMRGLHKKRHTEEQH